MFSAYISIVAFTQQLQCSQTFGVPTARVVILLFITQRTDKKGNNAVYSETKNTINREKVVES